MLKVQYEGFSCQVLHGGTMTEPIEVKTGVGRGMPSFAVDIPRGT